MHTESPCPVSPEVRPRHSHLSPSERLMSVDALRGFDMFWIIGADSLVYALDRMTQTRATRFLAEQLDHADWAGFRFYDLIFPLFVFLVGVSLVFSLSKAIQGVGRREALGRVFRRSALLFAVGIFYSGGFTNPWPDMRLMGVLNRIALAYFGAGLLFLYLRPRGLMVACATILIGYWAVMTWVPIRDIQLEKGNLARLAEAAGDAQGAALLREPTNPSSVKGSGAWAAAERLYAGTTNYVTGRFEKGLNVSDHLDFRLLPGRKYDVFFDPEGILSTLPAVASCLLGVFAGLLLRNGGVSPQQKVWRLAGAGAAAVALGWLWHLQFPVVKKVWTSSFVLVAGGYSALLLALFYQVVEIWQRRQWCQPFVWMGMNSITVYLAANFLGGFRKLGTRLAGGDIREGLNGSVAAGAGDLLISILGLLLAFWFVWFLHRKKVFLRM